MHASITSVIADCHEGSEADRIDFPTSLGKLNDAGVEGYFVDFRRSTKTYYLPEGESLELPAHRIEGEIAAAFHTGIVEDAVREAQAKAPGYTYFGFCRKVMAAGCAGYFVSILGRRVVYFGRTAETHVEYFPSAK